MMLRLLCVCSRKLQLRLRVPRSEHRQILMPDAHARDRIHESGAHRFLNTKP